MRSWSFALQRHFWSHTVPLIIKAKDPADLISTGHDPCVRSGIPDEDWRIVPSTSILAHVVRRRIMIDMAIIILLARCYLRMGQYYLKSHDTIMGDWTFWSRNAEWIRETY